MGLNIHELCIRSPYAQDGQRHVASTLLVDRPVGLLAGWLAGYLGWLGGWLAWLSGWLAVWRCGWLVGWMDGSLVCLSGWLSARLSVCQSLWLAGCAPSLFPENSSTKDIFMFAPLTGFGGLRAKSSELKPRRSGINA